MMHGCCDTDQPMTIEKYLYAYIVNNNKNLLMPTCCIANVDYSYLFLCITSYYIHLIPCNPRNLVIHNSKQFTFSMMHSPLLT